jgi:adenylate cyclase
LVLDIGKLYFGGVTADWSRPIVSDATPQVEFEIQFCQRVLERAPAHYDALTLLGEAYTRHGDFDKGLELDLKLAQLQPRNGMVRYNLACSYALTGRTDDALKNLSTAVDLGYNDVEHLCKDKDLAVLKEDPRFQTLVEKLVAKRRGQHNDPLDKEK